MRLKDSKTQLLPFTWHFAETSAHCLPVDEDFHGWVDCMGFPVAEHRDGRIPAVGIFSREEIVVERAVFVLGGAAMPAESFVVWNRVPAMEAIGHVDPLFVVFPILPVGWASCQPAYGVVWTGWP